MNSSHETIIDAYIGNPFTVPPPLRARADELLRDLSLGRTLSRLLGSGEVEQAKLLTLAVGHAQACRHADAPARILDSRSVPSKIASRLPRSLATYRRIAAAAGRCHHALAAVHGTSAQMHQVRSATWAACFGHSLRDMLDLERVIRDHDVLITGETGTGKEIFAQAIQRATPGGAAGEAAPSSAINAAAIPDTLVESELFGHEKGAFTGASETRTGRLRSASGGAFFLDEVGDLPRTTQVKLLRVIETNMVYPVGSDAGHAVDLRYIAATHKDLAAMVAAGRFRQDLYQRLAGNVIHIPPLRERPEDIIAIGLEFVSGYVDSAREDRLEQVGKWLEGPEARACSWPGNVRELQNALRNLLLGLPPGICPTPAPPLADADEAIPAPIRAATATMESVTEWYLRRVLDQTGGNYTRAAHILAIDRSTVRRRAGR